MAKRKSSENKNKEILDILSNQVIDIATLVNEADNLISSGEYDIYEFNEIFNANQYDIIDDFVKRTHFILSTCYSLFRELYNENVNKQYVNEKMVITMATTIEYRNIYQIGGFAYKLFNSMLGACIKTFTKINSEL